MVSAAAQHGVVERVFGTMGEELPKDVANYFLSVRLTDADHQRIAELSEKANEGDLSSEERAELRAYVLLNDFLTIMQSRAKRTLGKTSPLT